MNRRRTSAATYRERLAETYALSRLNGDLFWNVGWRRDWSLVAWRHLDELRGGATTTFAPKDAEFGGEAALGVDLNVEEGGGYGGTCA